MSDSTHRASFDCINLRLDVATEARDAHHARRNASSDWRKENKRLDDEFWQLAQEYSHLVAELVGSSLSIGINNKFT